MGEHYRAQGDLDRDVEMEVLRRERDRLREELQRSRDRFRQFAQASRRFASSMRSRMNERRRVEFQYLILDALEAPAGIDESASKVLEVMGHELGASLGMLWKVDEEALRHAATWRPNGATPDHLELACRDMSFSPDIGAAGLPPQIRRVGVPTWVHRLGEVDDPRAGDALEGERGVLALPIANSGGLLYVMEFFGLGDEAPDEGLMRTFRILGNQVAQVLERRRAEEALRESEARSRNILESITNAFVAVDRDWRLTYLNRRAEDLLGEIPRNEAMGRELWEVFRGLPGSPFEVAYRRAADERTYSTVTAYYPDHDRWYESHAYPASDGGIVIYVGDVTKRERAERILRASAERASFLARFTDATRAVSDPTDVLAAAIRLLGEQLGADRVVYAEIEPDDEHFFIASDFTNGVPSMAGRYPLSAFNPALVSAIRTGESIAVADVYTDPLAAGEREAYASVEVRAHIDAPLVKGGRLTAFLGVHQARPRAWTGDEIALVQEVAERTRSAVERARAEVALRESEAFVSAVNDTVSVGIVIVDMEGTPRIVYSNPAAQRILDRTARDLAEMSGRDFLSLIHPEDRGGFVRFFERCRRADDRPLRREYRVRHGDGEYLWVDTSCVSFEGGADGAVTQCLFVFEDVTERRRAQRERERLRAMEVVAHAQAAERRAISRDLHDRVAHDMAVVHQNLQLFGALKEADPARAASKLRAAEESVKVALNATRSLSSELRRLEAEEGLGKALEEFTAAAAESSSGNGALSRVRTSVSVRGDESLLPEHLRGQAYLILREAVRNALKHSRCTEIAVELEISSSGFSGSVVDDGVGFDPDDEDVRFGGVGLQSMRERIELLGGIFRLNTVQGRGTRVEIALNLEGGDQL